MAIAGELINILGFKLEGKENLKLFNQGMDNAAVAAEKNASRIRTMGVAAGAVTTGLIAMGVQGVKTYAEFERHMLRIGTNAGVSKIDIINAGKEVERMADRLALPLNTATDGLDTLIASGLEFKEAMTFLPAVLATTQATGADVNDIANAALKASSALKISAQDLQLTFDVMSVSGKSGQFEVKDMAAQIPQLATMFASLGYQGVDGFKRLTALAQTVREDSATAGEAATNLSNVFQKMFSQQTEKNFKKFGHNIRDEMKQATDSGKDLMESYIAVVQKVLKDNPKAKITDLFSDVQVQQGMLSLINSVDRYKFFLDSVNNDQVNGAVFRDLQKFTDDTTGSIQKMSNAWGTFMQAVGGSVAPVVTPMMNAGTNFLTRDQAINATLAKRGVDGFWGRLNAKYGQSDEDLDRMAREGGYAPTPADMDVQKSAPDAYRVLGRYPRRPNSTVSTRGDESQGIATREYQKQFGDIIPTLAAINSNLANMTQGAAAGATITDSRQDNRQFPVTVNAPVSMTVTQPTAAPAAVGAAVAGAIGKAATDSASRIEKDPAF